MIIIIAINTRHRHRHHQSSPLKRPTAHRLTTSPYTRDLTLAPPDAESKKLGSSSPCQRKSVWPAARSWGPCVRWEFFSARQRVAPIIYRIRAILISPVASSTSRCPHSHSSCALACGPPITCPYPLPHPPTPHPTTNALKRSSLRTMAIFPSKSKSWTALRIFSSFQ